MSVPIRDGLRRLPAGTDTPPSPAGVPAAREKQAHGHSTALLLLLLAMAFSALGPAAAQSPRPRVFRGAPVRYVDVVNTYPHDPDAYTQGLAVAGDVLFESTGRYGESGVRRIDLHTGQVLSSQAVSEFYFGEGLTLFGDRLIQLTWRAGAGFVYHRDTLARTGEFDYKGEGWGITHDGDRLIVSDGTSTLRFYDPVTFELQDELEVWDEVGAVSGLNELEYVKGELLANVFPSELIARISPETGEVTGWIYLRGLLDRSSAPDAEMPNGIAYDSKHDRLYVTGKLWPYLYEIQIIENP
ncbi:MAG: hypothetical protein MAG453_02120 [Calditrichaeota bacterium]|nr:hypothetical protein [Calditrichota bacterium]